MLPATCGEAVAAVDRLGAARPERYLGLAAAARARRREHLTGSGRVAAAATATATHVRGTATEITALGLAGCAAGGAATRLAELSFSEESLLARAEDELLVAILANQGLVRCVQRTLLANAASATRLSRREPLRGAIVAAAGFGAYWPVGGSVHASRALCLLFQYVTAAPPPAPFARYIASSARRTRAGASPPAGRCQAMPTLAPI